MGIAFLNFKKPLIAFVREVFFMSINIFKIFNIWSIRNCLVLNKRWIGVNTPPLWGNYAI